MLDELDSYTPSDFLLFSRETYFRLFELHNEAYWPMHVLAVSLGIGVLYLLRRGDGRSTRVASALLALAWAWVAWAFHLDRYAEINIAAPYFAVLFGLEAVLLAVIGSAGGWLGRADPPAPAVGTAVVVYAVLVHPLIGLLAGRTWTEVSVFGMAPDPTAIGTLGALLLVGGGLRWLLLVPALLWCAVAVLTDYAMESMEGVVPAVALSVAVLFSFRSLRMRTHRSPTS